jgi:hypothetical protein
MNSVRKHFPHTGMGGVDAYVVSALMIAAIVCIVLAFTIQWRSHRETHEDAKKD